MNPLPGTPRPTCLGQKIEARRQQAIDILLQVITQLIQLHGQLPVTEERSGIEQYISGLQQHVNQCYNVDPAIYIRRTMEYTAAAQKYISDHQQYRQHLYQQQQYNQQQIVIRQKQEQQLQLQTRVHQTATAYGIDLRRLNAKVAGSRNGYYNKRELENFWVFLRPGTRLPTRKEDLVTGIYLVLQG